MEAWLDLSSVVATVGKSAPAEEEQAQAAAAEPGELQAVQAELR